MKMRSFLFHPLLFLLPVVHNVSGAGEDPIVVGGWQPLEDVSDPHVQELGDFAVSEYNKEKAECLSFKRVVDGQTQVVAGINYRLYIEAVDGEATNTYEAVVWEKAGQGFRSLTSFKLVKS